MKTKINYIEFILESFIAYFLKIILKFLTSHYLAINKIYPHCMLHKFQKWQCDKLVFCTIFCELSSLEANNTFFHTTKVSIIFEIIFIKHL